MSEQQGNGDRLAVADMDFVIETVRLDELNDHPQNYQQHPQDQIDHLRASLRRWGPFRNIVIARDNTILAGHGISKAAKQEGWEYFPAKRYDLDPFHPEALALVVADNESGNLAERNDRGLVDILKSVAATDETALMGTGLDSMMLANLDMVTRPPDELKAHNEADHWVGLPDYEPAKMPYKVIVQCETDEERHEFLEMIGAKDDPKYTMVQTRTAISMWWPLQEVKADRKNAAWLEGEDGEVDDTPGLSSEEVQELIRQQELEQELEEQQAGIDEADAAIARGDEE